MNKNNTTTLIHFTKIKVKTEYKNTGGMPP